MPNERRLSRFDLHAHTRASPDSWIEPRELARIAKGKGLAGVAVTDHSSVSGWEEAVAGAEGLGVLVIRGEEVGVKPAGRTVGEILGLFMNERVDGNGKSASEIIDDLKRQDAVVVLPHPFDPWRKVLPEGELREIAVKADAVEVFNARALMPSYNEKAKEFARELGLSETGGSDAHAAREVGAAYTSADACDEEGLRKALKSGETRAGGRLHNFLFARGAAMLAKARSRVFGKRK
ncbi:MAG: PHP domain-containing protein [Candidatus ainarchaeum sp.]|nr:PHP domain-containing protein [Candidatus ainarchaeum sp.]